jgi:hypothetical protein
MFQLKAQIYENARVIELMVLNEKDSFQKERKLYALKNMNLFSPRKQIEMLELIIPRDDEEAQKFEWWFLLEFGDGLPS